MGSINTFQSQATTQGAGATGNRRCGMGASLGSNTTEANRQVRHRIAGTFSKFYATILTNDRGASTFRVRINSVNGNEVLAIPASTTGEFEDVVNTDAIVSGDGVNYQTITGAGGTTFTFNVMRIIFRPTTGTTTVFANDPTNITSTTVFNPVQGGLTGSTGTEASNQIKMQTAGTFANIGIFISTNTRDADVTFRLRVNEANVNETVTIGAGLTGWFEDLVNTDVVAVANRVNFTAIGAGTVGTVTTQTSKIGFTTTNSSFMFGGAGSESIAASATIYYTVAGDIFASATEANQVADSGLKIKASKMGFYLSSNTITAASTVNFRKNAANGSQTFSVPGLTAGHFQDSTNTDTVQATDSIATQIIAGAGGTSMVLKTQEMLGTTGGAVKDVICSIGMVPWVR